MQAGSSIMPGKVNPGIPVVVNQIAFEVIGNDETVSVAALTRPALAIQEGDPQAVCPSGQ